MEVVPPGQQCRYDGVLEEPPTARIGIILLLIAWPATLVALTASARGSDHRSQR